MIRKGLLSGEPLTNSIFYDMLFLVLHETLERRPSYVPHVLHVF